MSSSSLSRWRPRWLVAPIIIANIPSTLAQGQFETFFPGWGSIIKKVLNETCAGELKNYTESPDRKWEVVDCILDDFSESRKAEGAAAALTFGMAPMVLQNIGPNTSETSLLFFRRPLLALLLAISSPWPRNPDSKIYENIIIKLPTQTEGSEYQSLYQPGNPASKQPAETSTEQPAEKSTEQPAEQLEVESEEWPIWPKRDDKKMRTVVLFIEYAMALGAAANVALLAYQLGYWAFFASANNTYDPTLFTYCVLLIHLVGILGTFLQFRVVESSDDVDNLREKNLFQRWLFNEFRPAAHNTRLRISERKILVPLKLLITWVVSIAPTFQVLMGTVMLSGSLLTAQGDARRCLFRYIASTIVARALVMYELNYLTRKYDDPKLKENSALQIYSPADHAGQSIWSRPTWRLLSRRSGFM